MHLACRERRHLPGGIGIALFPLPYTPSRTTQPSGKPTMPCGRKRKRRKIATHKRKKRKRLNRHKKKLR